MGTELNRFIKLSFLVTLVLFCLTGISYAGEFGFTKRNPRLVKSTGKNIQLMFNTENSVEYLITNGDWAGWHISCSWDNPYPLVVQENEVVAVNTKCGVVRAGPGAIGASLSVYLGEGDGNRLIDRGSVGAGRSGSTGQIYSGNGVAKYRLVKGNNTTMTLIVQFGDGGGTDAILATYLYTYVATGAVPYGRGGVYGSDSVSGPVGGSSGGGKTR